MEEELQGFENVTLSITPIGGTKVSTQCIFDLSGLGSSRSSNKKKCLNNKTLLAVGTKEYETLSFSLPYSETADEFHAVAVSEYDDNNTVVLELVFDNMPDGGTNGTTISGNAKIISYKPDNDSNSIVSSFTMDWAGAPATKGAA